MSVELLLSSSEVAKARTYNQRRGLTESEIKSVQEVVGVMQDGVIGSQTTEAVARWQDKVGLPVDGRLGPNTYAALMISYGCLHPRPSLGPLPSVVAKSGGTKHGLWWDIDSTKSLKDGAHYKQQLLVLGFDHLMVMVDSSSPDNPDVPKVKWSPERFARFAQIMAPEIEVGVTFWGRPRLKYILEIEKHLKGFIQAGASRIELDGEGNWRSRHLDGYQSLFDAGFAMGTMLERLKRDSGGRVVSVESTSYLEHGEFDQPTYSRWCDTIVPQSYSHYNEGDATSAIGGIFGPGKNQEHAVGVALGSLTALGKRTPQTVNVVMGLAAYDQDYPGKTKEEVMSLAYQTVFASAASKRLTISGIRWWSAKWVLPYQSIYKALLSVLKAHKVP